MVGVEKYKEPLIVCSRLNRTGSLFDVVSVSISECGAHVVSVCTAFYGSGIAVGKWRLGRHGAYGFFARDIPSVGEFSYFCDLFRFDVEIFPVETAILIEKMYVEVIRELRKKLAINFSGRDVGKRKMMRKKWE